MTSPIVKVHGSPYECGVQHGQQTKALIQRNINYYLDYWSRNLGMSLDEVYTRAHTILGQIRRYDGDIALELEGVADGANIDSEPIVAINGRYELAWASPAQLRGGCTSIAALPSATKTGTTLLAQNWDYRLGVKETCILLDVTQEDKPRVAMHTEAGIIGHKGLNSEGIGVVLNALVSDKDRLGDSVPFFTVCRKMLNSNSFTEAVKAFLKADRCVSYNVMVASEGVVVNLEAHPSDVSVITPEGGILAHSNHFIGDRALNVKDMYLPDDPSTLHRHLIANEMLNRKDHSVESFKEILRNHFDYPESICFHIDPAKMPDHQEETLSSVVMDIEGKALYYTDGPPCSNPYQRYHVVANGY
ncbi:MAG: C45 family peptidase [Candidatus Bathyarchaeota archaeon]|nr:C45 family peptidase [Candidatus Bathyarchaeota archaeon]